MRGVIAPPLTMIATPRAVAATRGRNGRPIRFEIAIAGRGDSACRYVLTAECTVMCPCALNLQSRRDASREAL